MKATPDVVQIGDDEKPVPSLAPDGGLPIPAQCLS